MRTVSFISRLAIAASAAALPAGAADAGVVFDSFNASGQVALAGGSIAQTQVESAPNTSASSAGIAPVAGSRNSRVARAGWQSYGDVFYTDQQKAARYANTIVDTTIGAAVFGFGGKVDVARSSLSYAAQVGSWMDFASNGYGIGLEGALTGATGISDPFYQGMTIDIVVTDRFGVSANHTFFSNTLKGTFTGLDGTLVANFADFQFFAPPDNPFATPTAVDFSRIVSMSLNFEYLNYSLGGAPDVVGSYQLNQITIVPAPGAIALLAAAGLVGSARRRA
jgi:hypothetical protein